MGTLLQREVFNFLNEEREEAECTLSGTLFQIFGASYKTLMPKPWWIYIMIRQSVGPRAPYHQFDFYEYCTHCNLM